VLFDDYAFHVRSNNRLNRQGDQCKYDKGFPQGNALFVCLMICGKLELVTLSIFYVAPSEFFFNQGEVFSGANAS